MNNLLSEGEDSEEGGYNVLKVISKQTQDEKQQLITGENEENNAQTALAQSHREDFAGADEFMNNIFIKNPISQSHRVRADSQLVSREPSGGLDDHVENKAIGSAKFGDEESGEILEEE